jgi:hypothetical protein
MALGAGRTSAADKRHFYELAKGSALASASALQLLGRGVPPDSYRRGRGVMIRLAQMLTRMPDPPR